MAEDSDKEGAIVWVASGTWIWRRLGAAAEGGLLPAAPQAAAAGQSSPPEAGAEAAVVGTGRDLADTNSASGTLRRPRPSGGRW